MTSQPAILAKLTHSLKWSALVEIVSRTASPIVFLILARLLTPEDFGAVAVAMIPISFSQMFWDAGLSKALIQTKAAPEAAANVVFWTNLVMGLVLYLALCLAAPWIAAFFDSRSSIPLLRVLGLQIVLASFGSVQQTLFMRDFDFRRLFWIKLATAFVPGLFSIPFALLGQGPWALVIGTLAGQLLNLALLWRHSPWRPTRSFDSALARTLFSFGFWVVLESLGAWFIVWGDSLVVGRFLGVHDLGVYRTGTMLVTTIFGLLLNPFLPVIYPTFARLQEHPSELTRTFHSVNRLIIAIAVPTGLGLLLVGPELAALLFPQKWAGLGFVLGVIGLMAGAAWLVGLNSELYRAMGRPDLNTKLMYAQLLYYLPAYYLAARHSFEAFVWTRLGVALLATPIHVFLCTRMLRLSPFYLWQEGRPMFLSAALMALAVLALKSGLALRAWPIPGWLSLALLVGLGAATYALCLRLLDPQFIAKTTSHFRKAAVA